MGTVLNILKSGNSPFFKLILRLLLKQDSNITVLHQPAALTTRQQAFPAPWAQTDKGMDVWVSPKFFYFNENTALGEVQWDEACL